MARIVAPLHSDDASGLYGGTKNGVVYCKWRNVRYARSYAVPSQPRTVAQLRNRATLRCLKAVWDTFNDSQVEYWASYGTMWNLPAWQAFCRYNLRQAQQGWTPQMEANSEHLETPDAPVDLDASVVDNALVATWTDVASPYTVGLHLGASAGFTPAQSNLVYSTPSVDGAERQATILVAPGTYYLKARGGGQDGGVGTPSTAVGPLVVT